MNNLKDELNHIDIPKELRARAQQGIEQAAKEQESEPSRESKATVQPSKKRKLLVGVFTSAVTAAAALFLVAVVSQDAYTLNTANGAATAKIWYSKWLVIPVLSVLLMALLYGTLKLIRKFPQRKGLTIFGSLIGVYCLGVGIWYTANMLQERIVLPIAMEFVKGQESYIVPIRYLVDRFDSRTDIEALIIDEHVIELEDFEKEYLSLEHSIQMNYPGFQYAFKSASFRVSAAVLEGVIEGRADLSNSKVRFLDGTIVPIEIKHLDYSKDAQGNDVLAEPVQSWSASSGERYEYILEGETKIERIAFPLQSNMSESYEVKLGDQVIKRINYYNQEDIDLLPIEVEDANVLSIRIDTSHWEEQVLKFEFPLLIYGENKIYEASITNMNVINTGKEQIQAILESRKE